MEEIVKNKDTEGEMRKQKIIDLLTKVLDKYEAEHNVVIKRDTYREHYKGVAEKLGKISMNLPTLVPTMFMKMRDLNHYEVTDSQVEAAFKGRPKKMKTYFAAACLIYLNKDASTKDFENEVRELSKGDTVDVNLISEENETLREKLSAYSFENEQLQQHNANLQQQYDSLTREKEAIESANTVRWKKAFLLFGLSVGLATIIIAWGGLSWKKEVATGRAVNQLLQHQFDSSRKAWNTIKEDFHILPYKASPEQLALYEGYFLAYAPSPQVRTSKTLAERRDKVVSNFVHFTKKDGYLVFDRYGPGFNQKGVLQFESSTVVSLNAYLNKPDTVESPKHSIWTIKNGKPDTVALSTTWNFDEGDKNFPIASREVYHRLGNGAPPRVEGDSKEAFACDCKFVYWTKDGKKMKDSVRTQPIHTLPKAYQRFLTLDGILLRGPEDKNRLNKD